MKRTVDVSRASCLIYLHPQVRDCSKEVLSLTAFTPPDRQTFGRGSGGYIDAELTPMQAPPHAVAVVTRMQITSTIWIACETLRFWEKTNPDEAYASASPPAEG